MDFVENRGQLLKSLHQGLHTNDSLKVASGFLDTHLYLNKDKSLVMQSPLFQIIVRINIVSKVVI
jgi:hypothetical protein